MTCSASRAAPARPRIAVTPEAAAHLARRDVRLGRLIAALGPLSRERDPDAFTSLVHHIVGQQISGKAQAAVWARLLALAGLEEAVTPGAVLRLGEAGVRSAGMSAKKAQWITEIARRADSGRLDLPGLEALSDEEVVARLTDLPGVGVWTAEMILIFGLGRGNVLSFGDFGIRAGLMRLYGHKALPRARFDVYARRFSPFGTAASLLIWEVGNGRADPTAWLPRRTR